MFRLKSALLLVFLANVIQCQTNSDKDPKCFEKPAVGKCRGFIPMFYFDYTKGYCQCYIYSGCQGTGNRFLTLKQCTDTCKPTVHLEPPKSRNDCVRQFTNPEFKPTLDKNDTESLQNLFNELTVDAADPTVDKVEHRGPQTQGTKPQSPVAPIPVVPRPLAKPAPVVPAPKAPTTTPSKIQSSETTLSNIQKSHEQRIKEQQRQQQLALQRQQQQQDEIIKKHHEVTSTVYRGSGGRSQGQIKIGQPISIGK